MFKFLKEKLKKAVNRVTKEVEKEPEKVEKPKAEDFKEIPEKTKEAKKIEKPPKKPKPPKKKPEKIPKKEPKKEKPEKERIEEKPKKKSFVSRLTKAVSTKKISEAKFDGLFWELEVALLENNVAFEVIEKIKDDLKKDLVDVPIKRGNVEKRILESLKQSITGLFEQDRIDIAEKIKKEEKPYVIAFLGANGSGKTTSIAKIAYLLKKQKLNPVLAAADTWRSAAIQQLEQHAKKLDVPIVKHDYGADPAAVAFDAVKMARARKLDVVLIDTAGRQHSNANLVEEMKKIIRVAKPDLKLYVGEMIAGNDCIEQINTFNKAIDIDAVILSKADIDEKGGTAISVTYVTKKPIAYLGVGQEYRDLELFDKERILKNLGL